MSDHHHAHPIAAPRPKLTKGCKRVLDVLEHAHDLTSAQDIHNSMRGSGNDVPGLTTVYRSLESLVSMGLVQAVELGDGERRYELISPGEHHHHLVCDKCQTSIHLDQCVLQDLEKSIREIYGFNPQSHILEIFGTCKTCNQKL